MGLTYISIFDIALARDLTRTAKLDIENKKWVWKYRLFTLVSLNSGGSYFNLKLISEVQRKYCFNKLKKDTQSNIVIYVLC